MEKSSIAVLCVTSRTKTLICMDMDLFFIHVISEKNMGFRLNYFHVLKSGFYKGINSYTWTWNNGEKKTLYDDKCWFIIWRPE